MSLMDTVTAIHRMSWPCLGILGHPIQSNPIKAAIRVFLVICTKRQVRSAGPCYSPLPINTASLVQLYLIIANFKCSSLQGATSSHIKYKCGVIYIHKDTIKELYALNMATYISFPSSGIWSPPISLKPHFSRWVNRHLKKTAVKWA